VRLTTSPPSFAECHENLGAENAWNPVGHSGPVTGLFYLLTRKDDSACELLLPFVGSTGTTQFLTFKHVLK
jgi:hypothetical protein